jgi:hypothetical protein
MAEMIKPQIKKTWKPIAAGVLDIILGCFWLLGGLGIIIIIMAYDLIRSSWSIFGEASISLKDYCIAVPALIAGALAISGGIYTAKRNKWWFALIGSVAAFLPIFISMIDILYYAQAQGSKVTNSGTDLYGILFLLAGAAAIVLTALSKSEFE